MSLHLTGEVGGEVRHPLQPEIFSNFIRYLPIIVVKLVNPCYNISRLCLLSVAKADGSFFDAALPCRSHPILLLHSIILCIVSLYCIYCLTRNALKGTGGLKRCAKIRYGGLIALMEASRFGPFCCRVAFGHLDVSSNGWALHSFSWAVWPRLRVPSWLSVESHHSLASSRVEYRFTCVAWSDLVLLPPSSSSAVFLFWASRSAQINRVESLKKTEENRPK